MNFTPNGIFKFNITKLLTFIQSKPDVFSVENVLVSDVRLCVSSKLNEVTIQTAIISNPIILAEISPGRFNVIDGNHRLEKAYRDKMTTLPAYRVLAEHHIAFLSSVNAYEKYVEYWNEKLGAQSNDVRC